MRFFSRRNSSDEHISILTKNITMTMQSLTFSAGANNPKTESAIPKYDGNGFSTPDRPPLLYPSPPLSALLLSTPELEALGLTPSSRSSSASQARGVC